MSGASVINCDTTFVYNSTTTADSDAIYAALGTLTISSCDITIKTEGSAPWKFGISASSVSTLTFEKCTFRTLNVCNNGVTVAGHDINISDSIINLNANNYGLASVGTIDIRNSVLNIRAANNTAIQKAPVFNNQTSILASTDYNVLPTEEYQPGSISSYRWITSVPTYDWTVPLDFTSNESSGKALATLNYFKIEGADDSTWNDNTLTLNGVDYKSTATQGIIMPDNSTINVNADSKIVAKCVDVTTLIQSSGKLTITGEAHLDVIVKSGAIAGTCTGIKCTNLDGCDLYLKLIAPGAAHVQGIAFTDSSSTMDFKDSIVCVDVIGGTDDNIALSLSDNSLIEECDITVNKSKEGISVNGQLTIKNSDLNIRSTVYGISSTTLAIDNCNLDVVGDENAVSADTITVENLASMKGSDDGSEYTDITNPSDLTNYKWIMCEAGGHPVPPSDDGHAGIYWFVGILIALVLLSAIAIAFKE